MQSLSHLFAFAAYSVQDIARSIHMH